MKNIYKLWIVLIIVAVVGIGLWFLRPDGQNSADGNSSAAVSGEYIIKYEWPENPKVGDYTLKVNVSDRSGNPVQDVDVVASYDMPSMRGHHAASENMKLSSRGDFLLPIHFAMRGDWEIILVVNKDGREAAVQEILLNI